MKTDEWLEDLLCGISLVSTIYGLTNYPKRALYAVIGSMIFLTLIVRIFLKKDKNNNSKVK